MKTCCRSTTKDKQCVRKSDSKQFKLPRRFTKKDVNKESKDSLCVHRVLHTKIV